MGINGNFTLYKPGGGGGSAGSVQAETLALVGSTAFGTTNTTVRRFQTTVQNTLSTIMSYTASSTDGDSFTALVDCFITCSYRESGITGASAFAIILNGTSTATSTGRIGSAETNTSAPRLSCSGSIRLTSGDIIRCVVENAARHSTVDTAAIGFSFVAYAD